MKIPFTSIVLALALAVGSTNLLAQPVQIPGQPVAMPTRDLGVCYLFAENTPELYVQDAMGEFKRLRIDTKRFRNWNRVPARKQVTFYARVPDPEAPGEFRMTPAGQYNLPGEVDERVRLIFYFTAEGKTDFFTLKTNSDIHAAFQTRVFNLTDTDIAISVDGEEALIKPRSESAFAPVSEVGERFRLQFAYQRAGEPPFRSTGKSMRFVKPDQRLTLIFGYQPEFEDGDENQRAQFVGWGIRMLQFYDLAD